MADVLFNLLQSSLVSLGRSCANRLEQSAGPEEAGTCSTQLPLTLANTEVILQVSSLFLQPTSPSGLPWSSQFGSCTGMMLLSSWVLSAVGAEYTCVRSPGCCQARQRAQFPRSFSVGKVQDHAGGVTKTPSYQKVSQPK